MQKVVLILALMLMTGAFLSGCGNTVHGMGQDIERAGERIQRF